MTETPSHVVTFNERISQYQFASEMAQRAWSKWRSYRDRQEAKTRYYVSVEDGDRLFDLLQMWLLKDVNVDGQRELVAESDREWDPEYGDAVWFVKFMADADFASEVELEGVPIAVEITSRKAGEPKRSEAGDALAMLSNGGISPAPTMGQLATLTNRIIFTCYTKEERDIVLRFLEKKVTELDKRQPSFNTATAFGSWRRTGTIGTRPLDSVVLAEDASERVVADFDKFLAQEKRYIELGLPYHRGYLFYGPPGTGKTSLGSALATHFKRDVYYIPLTSMESDSKLAEAVTGIESKKAVVIFEDVDIVAGARDRDDQHKGVTMQGLLNTLDGFATPHGMIMIMTTNDREVLDPALVRPGRVDYELHIGYVTDDQLQRLCERFIGRRVNVPRLEDGRLTPAQIVGVFKNGDTDDVDDQLTELVREANASALNADSLQDGVQTRHN